MKMTSSAAMLMVYYKNEDNFADSGFFGKLISLIIKPFALASKKGGKALPRTGYNNIRCDEKAKGNRTAKMPLNRYGG